MNEKYLQDLYSWITGNDSSYEGRYSFDAFKQKMQDEGYASQMHDWISKKDDSFSQRRPLDQFIQQVKIDGVSTAANETADNVKKKIVSATTGSPSDGTSLAVPSQDGQPKFDESIFDFSPQQRLASDATRVANIPLSDIRSPEKIKAQQESEQKILAEGKKLNEIARAKRLKDETPKEENYFKGKFGEVLNALDNLPSALSAVSFLGLGDFIDDTGRAIDAGFSNGAVVTPANELMIKGSNASSELIKKYYEAAKQSSNIAPSDEMISFTKTYQDEGQGWFGLIKGLAENPGVVPEMIVSSFATMLNPSSLAAAGAVVGGAAITGAILGEGVGAGPAAQASIPYAMGAANVTLETGLTFSELLQNELTKRNLEFTEENVKKVLEDDEAMKTLRAKSVARGAAIGVIDAITGRVAGKVGAKLARKTPAAAVKQALLNQKAKGALAATGIEMVGGSLGETAGRVAAGQELDVAEIGLEGIAEAPMSIPSLAAEVLKKPVYIVNGDRRTEADVKDIIERNSPEDLAKIDIKIKNDNKGFNNLIQDKIVTHQIKTEVKEANPDLNEPSLNAITELEKKLKTLEGNKTQTGKDKAAAIKQQIKDIQENQIQEETVAETAAVEKQNVLLNYNGDPIEDTDQINSINNLFEERLKGAKSIEEANKIAASIGFNVAEDKKEAFNNFIKNRIEGTTQDTLQSWVEKAAQPTAVVTETVVAETPEVTANRNTRISEIESMLSGDKAEIEKTGQSKLLPEAKTELETELQTLKTEQDAIQKQAANESVLRGEQPQVGLPKVGEGNIQPQVVATGTEEVVAAQPGKEVTPEQTDIEKRRQEELESKGLNRLFPLLDETNPEAKKIAQEMKEQQKNINEVNAKYDAELKALEEKQQAVPVVKTQEEINAEAEKLTALLGTPSGEPKFRLAEGTDQPLVTNTEAIETEMNNMPATEIEFTEPSVSQKGLKVNPVAESNSIVKIAKKIGDALMKPIQYFNGIPMIVGMSDMLAAGRIKDSAGNDMDVEGGLLFNVLGKNKNAAWAGVTKEGAQTQYDNAVKLYNSNKELFDRLWSEGKLPDGHIPMAIMRMADTAVNSNEAAFRWVLPTVESFSQKNKQNAMNAFNASANKKLSTKADASKAKKILTFIKDKNITSLDQFFKEIISDANLRAKGSTDAKLNLDDRSLIYDLIFAPSDTKKASKPTIKSLLAGTDNSKNKIFTSDVIYKAIGEPSMLKTKQGEVVSIVGIDVKNGGVISVEHGNYGFGPKGQTIALIENPMHGTDVFPEFKAKTSRIFKKNKKGKLPNAETVASQAGGAFFTDKAFRGATVLAGIIDDMNLLIGKLRFAFPSVSVSTTQEEFNAIINSPDVRTRVSDGKVILGLTKDGKIYINPEMSSLQTPIHEFGHIWIDFLRSETSGKKGTELLNQGLKLVRDTDAHKQAVAKYGDTELALEEALVELMANKGATIINAAQKSKFKSWMNAAFKYIQKKFTTFKDVDAKKIGKMKLEDFINTGLADLFSGKEVSNKFSPELSEASLRARLSAITDINEIVKIGRANGISEEAITKVLTDKGFTKEEITKAYSEPIAAAKTIELSEQVLPGYDRLMSEVGGIVNKSERRNVSPQKIAENVKNYIVKSKVYENASDVQRETLIRDANKMFGIKEKAAPSAGKLFSTIKDITKITITEKTALVKQIKDLARGAKDAKRAIDIATQQLSKDIKELRGKGKITANQAANVIRAFSKTNVLSEKSVGKFTDYMTKVFAKADYADKLSTGKGLRKDIAKLSRDKNKNANLRVMAKSFSEIDPSMVENIEEYNSMAADIKQAIKGSTTRGEEVKFATAVNIDEVNNFTEAALENQDKILRAELAAEIQDLMGVDVSDLSYDQMMQMIDSKEDITKYNEDIIRSTINKMFNIYSAFVSDMLSTDPDISKANKDLVKRFMNMDLSLLTTKEALQTVDALSNFLENQSTAKMESVVSDYEGRKNALDLEKSGMKSESLKMFGKEGIARVFMENFVTLSTTIERMFKGFNAGLKFEKAMGLLKFRQEKANAEARAAETIDKYVNQFSETKPNGEAFNTEANSVERGMLAFIMRSVIGSPEVMQADFIRRKKLIAQSIDVLLKSKNKDQKNLGEIYTKVYDSILKDSNNVKEVTDKADETNLDAVKFWVDEWTNLYEKQSDVSKNIYNKILEKELNYTPDKFKKLKKEKTEANLIDDSDSSFHSNNGTIYKRSSSGLMEATHPDPLPDNMFIDLSFDNNNANSLKDALVDIGTAASIRQINAFLNSDSYANMIASEEDADLLDAKVKLFIRNARNKNIVENEELNSAMKKLNSIAALGVGQALGGIFQPIKQVIPIAASTLINTKGKLDIKGSLTKDFNDALDRSGYAIANRGIASQAQIESVNSLVEKAGRSNFKKAMVLIEKANRKMLDLLLVKFDVFIARASWKTYYEMKLDEMGIDSSEIDYSTHEFNEEAANYAENMVSKQQNISDADLGGKMLTSKDPVRQVVMKTAMPFASFRINTYAKMLNDMATLKSKISTEEDRTIAARSLAGAAAEQIMFKAISAGIIIGLGWAAKKAMGQHESGEERKKRINNVIKGQATSTVTDLLSPLPIFDAPVQYLSKQAIDATQKIAGVSEKNMVSIYDPSETNFLQSLGTFGITAQRADQLWDAIKLGYVTKKFTDEYGKEKRIKQKDSDALKWMSVMSLLSSSGLLPTEASSLVRYGIKYSKQNASSIGAATEDKSQVQEMQAASKKENKQEKIDRLNSMLDTENDEEVRSVITKELIELNMTDKEKREYNKQTKDQKDREYLEKKKLLKGYDNESDLKKYDRDSWEQNFGENSKWYEEHRAEKEVQKELNQLETDTKNQKYGYTPKKKKKRYNSDGTTRSSYTYRSY